MSEAHRLTDFVTLPDPVGLTGLTGNHGVDDDDEGPAAAMSITARGTQLASSDVDPGAGAAAFRAAPLPELVIASAFRSMHDADTSHGGHGAAATGFGASTWTLLPALPAVVGGAAAKVVQTGLPSPKAEIPGGSMAKLPATNTTPPGEDPVFGVAVSNPFGLTEVFNVASPALADVDDDGDLDAFVGSIDGSTQFFRNTGSASAPAFTAQVSNFGLTNVGGYASPALVDIDGDGDLDAFVGGRDGNTKFFRDTAIAGADPVFTAQGSNFGLTNIGGYASPTFADIDGDGDLDAFVGGRDGNTKFFRNTGSASAPAFTAEGSNFGLTDVGYFANPTLADIDGDGDLDAFVGEDAGDTLFFRNTGSATAPAFTADDNFGLTEVRRASPTLADIDGDGDLDALVGAFDGSVRYFVNAPPGVTIAQSGGSTAVTEGGATDNYSVVLKSAPTASVTITLDDTNGQVSTSAVALVFTPANWNLTQNVTVTAANDPLGEGAHFGVIGHTVSSADTGYDGLGVGTVRVAVTDDDLLEVDPDFGAAVNSPFGLADVGTFAVPTLVDIDGDGDLDAFIGERYGSTQFFRNTGSASVPAFKAEVDNLGLTDVFSYASPALADIDGDGDLDAFVGELFGSTQFFRNTGSAGAPAFTAEGNNFGLTDVGNYASPSLVDIDGDGDLDAFVGAGFGNTQFFRNAGSASAPVFTLQADSLGLTDVGSIARPTFADIDGDGDLDAFVGQADGMTAFFRNTGSASAPAFAVQGANFGLTDVGGRASPALADIDADGDLDAIVGANEGQVLFFVNNSAFVLKAPNALLFTDTAFDDSFASVSRTLSTRGAESAALTYGIDGGADNGSTVSRASAYGTLTVTKAGGGYSFVPDDAALEALGAAASVSFTVTVTNDTGTDTGSKSLKINVAQSGTTETPGNDTLLGTTGADRMASLAGNDSLGGGSGNDSLKGGSGKDTLAGSSGNDLLDGGNGNDRMTGGAGNDRYVVQSSGDQVVEASGGGTDSVSSSITHTLASHVEKLTLTGSSAINGHGNSLNNTIVGNSGNNLLRGSTGNDTITGGGGLDVFRFSSALSTSTNADRLTDFNPAQDVLQLENSVFTRLTTPGVLKPSNFKASSNGNASDSNDFVLYETDTGKLFYDADGHGAGAKVLLATLGSAPALTSADIFVT